MYFELFIFLTLIAVAFLVVASLNRRVWPALLATLFLVLVGAALMSDGMRVEVGSHYNIDTGVTTYDYNSLTPANDTSISMISNVFFYGGFLPAIVAMVFLFRGKVAQGKGGI